MARSGSGSNYARTPSAFAANSAATFSWHVWVRSSVAPNLGSFRAPLDIRSSTADSTNPSIGFLWDHTASSFSKAAYNRAASNTIAGAKLTSSLSADTWYPIGATFDGSNLRAYLNGALETTTATSAANSSNTFFAYINTTFSGGSAFPFTNGEVAEVGVWLGAVLTADDMQGLAQGFRPTHYRRDKLALYAPLINNAVDLLAAPLTDTGTPVYTDHPRVMGRL